MAYLILIPEIEIPIWIYGFQSLLNLLKNFLFFKVLKEG